MSVRPYPYGHPAFDARSYTHTGAVDEDEEGIYAPAMGVYPATELLIEWLSQLFYPIEQQSFAYWQERRDLVLGAHMDPANRIFQERLRAHNEQHRHLSLDELQVLASDHLPAGTGEWLAFSSLDAQPDILMADCGGDIIRAMYGAPDRVKWGILYLEGWNEIIVCRSPCVQGREIMSAQAAGLAGLHDDLPYANGRQKGEFETFTLPPEVESADFPVWQMRSHGIRQDRGR